MPRKPIEQLSVRLSAAEQEWIATTLACHGYRASTATAGVVVVLDPVHSDGHVVDYQQVTLRRIPDLWHFIEERS